jgi:hypothetical protein
MRTRSKTRISEPHNAVEDKVIRDESPKLAPKSTGRGRKSINETPHLTKVDPKIDGGEKFDLQIEDLFKFYPKLISHKELVDNHPWSLGRITYPFVSTCYRKPSNSYSSCVLALFTLHNEVFNSWTHIFGAFIAISLLYLTVSSVQNIMSVCILSTYIFGGLFMFFSSATFHTFCSHSDMASRFVQCLDWSGICAYIFSCNFLASYYELNSLPLVFRIFTIANVSIGILTSKITFTALKKLHESGESTDRKIALPDSQNVIIGNQFKAFYYHVKSSITSVLETYAFRTILAMVYGSGPLIAWFIGYYYNGVATCDIRDVLVIYLNFGTVVFCLFDFPEILMPPGTVDILVRSYSIVFIIIILQYY